MNKPLFLAIVNGLGVYEGKQKEIRNKARTKNINSFIKKYPVVTLQDNKALGCVSKNISDSKIGHVLLSAGRPYFPIPRQIDKDIEKDSFFENNTLNQAIDWSADNDSNLHLIGSLSEKESNAKLDHLLRLIELAERKGVENRIFLHLFIDEEESRESVNNLLKKIDSEKIATISSEDFALYHNGNYERIQQVHQSVFLGSGESFENTNQAIDNISERKVFAKESYEGLKESDSVLFFNYNAENIRKLAKSFSLPVFNKFERKHVSNILFTTLVEYEKNIATKVAYPPQVFHNCLTETIEQKGLRQFHVSETNKYSHISYYLNGKIPDSFDDEKRRIIDSPKVENFNERPEMSIKKLTDSIIDAIHSEENDVIIADFSNFEEVNNDWVTKLEALEIIDSKLGKIIDHLLVKEGTCVITSDYSQNIIKDEENTNTVPFIVVSDRMSGLSAPSGDPPEGDLSLIEPGGNLFDVAPTVLSLLNIEKPPEMVGEDLLS